MMNRSVDGEDWVRWDDFSFHNRKRPNLEQCSCDAPSPEIVPHCNLANVNRQAAKSGKDVTESLTERREGRMPFGNGVRL